MRRGRIPKIVAVIAAVAGAGLAAVGATLVDDDSDPVATVASDRPRATASTTTTTAPAKPPPTTTTAPPPPTTEAPAATAPEAAPPSAPAGPAAAGAGASAGTSLGWPLVWSDDFEGGAVDTGSWLVYEGTGNGGVGLRRPSAISQGDGELRITGRGDVSGGMSTRHAQTYGRWEVRARADRGNGYAPAILLWPTSNNWPEEGEIDLSEIPLGDRAESHFTVHWGADNQQTGFATAGDFTRWHTFGVEWAPDHITYYLDGAPLHTVTEPAAIPRNPMNLALQHDVGPFSWIPGRDASTPVEVSLRVDWVRIYAL